MPNVVAIGTLFGHLSKEVEAVSSSFYVMKALNRLAFNDPPLLAGLRANAQTWNVVLHSLQLTFFVSLGRLFDSDDRALSLPGFIARCRRDLTTFSKAEIEKRRIAANGGQRPDYLDGWLQHVHDATPQQFKDLRKAVARCKAIYANGGYDNIRNQIMAHRDISALDQEETFFYQTNIGEVLDVITSIQKIIQAVYDLYHNGRWLGLENQRIPDLDALYERDAADLLRKLAPSPLEGDAEGWGEVEACRAAEPRG